MTALAPPPPSPVAYIPKHLAERILTSRAALEGERKQVTVVFADLRGSLELLADRDPEDARALLDPVLTRMMDAVHRYEGTVNQILGDGIMALFGAPLALEDHALRACYAALTMQESVALYADEVRRTHGIPLQIRVGLHSGEVVVLAIKSDLSMDYRAVGQTTHLAARMEQMARPGSILITAETYRQAQDLVQAKPLGAVPVKGLDAPVEVCELVGIRPTRSRLGAAGARGLSPFVGRETEVAQLRWAAEQALRGHGQVVAVVGDPGVGKTRLLVEFTQSDAVSAWRCLESRAVSYAQGTPYVPVIDLLKRYFGLEDRDALLRIREEVTTRILTLDARLAEAIPPVLWLLEALPEGEPFGALEPPERRRLTLAAVKRLLLRESRRQPLLVVAENLQWIDTETQAFLDSLVESLPTARVLLLVSYRPDGQHGWGSKTYYTQLPIEPLSPESARALLRAILGDDAQCEPLTALLTERTEGNPFFLEESVRTLVETGALVGERGSYRLARALPGVQLPGTVQAMLAARIDRLPVEEKLLLQAASAIGRDVPFSLLEAIAEVPAEGLRAGLAHLVAAEFLLEANLFPELEYTFKHALTHEVTYGELLQERRRALHARIVGTLERLYADRLNEWVERLAHHAARGEIWDRAVGYLRQSGEKATARSANLEAVAYFEQALAALRHLPEERATLEAAVDLRLELRPPLVQLGRLRDALTLSEEAEQLARDLRDEDRLGRVYTYLINYHYLKGEPDTAIELGQRCLAIGEAVADRALQALARRYLGHSYHAQGRYRMAEAVLRANVEALEAFPDPDTAAQWGIAYVGSCCWLALTLADLGDFDLAATFLDKGRGVAEDSRQAYSEVIAWTAMGLVAARRGHLEEAIEPLARSLERCEEKDLVVWRPIPASVLGLIHVQLGRVDAGLRLLGEGVTLSEELDIRAYLALWTAHLAEGLLIAGQIERAQTIAERALDLARSHGERGHEAWTVRLLGEIAVRRDPPDVDVAAAHYGRAITLAGELGLRPVVARAQLGLARLNRGRGRRAEADAQFISAITALAAMDMRLWAEHACAELAALGQAVVVSRSDPVLYDYLTRVGRGLGAEGAVILILDRRQDERRRSEGAHTPERRQADRRDQPGPETNPATRGLVIIDDRTGHPSSPHGHPRISSTETDRSG